MSASTAFATKAHCCARQWKELQQSVVSRCRLHASPGVSDFGFIPSARSIYHRTPSGRHQYSGSSKIWATGDSQSGLAPRYMFGLTRRHKCTLVLGELRDGDLTPSTLSSICAAKFLNRKITLLLPCASSPSIEDVKKICQNTPVIDHLCLVTHAVYGHLLADSLSALLGELIEGSRKAGEQLEALGKHGEITALIAPVNAVSRDVLPRVAGMLGVQMISDVIEILEEGQSFVRPMYAGNAISTVKSKDSLKIINVRSTSFRNLENEQRKIEPATHSLYDPKSAQEFSTSKFMEWEKEESSMASDRPQLDTAKIVISGGRGLKNSENFEGILEPLRKKLNAALGASRAAVDSGFVPNDLQVGQTGKVVAPALYIAVGISGAIQHLAGMKDSRTIVAINKDPEAPIFQIADYGIVGDLFTILPELTSKIPQQ